MLESSKDILLIVLAICAIALTTFFCWLMYYFIAMTKNAHSMIKSVKSKFDTIDEILNSIKMKVNNTGALIAVAMKAFEKVGDYVQEKANKKTTNKTTRAKKKKAEVDGMEEM